MWPFSTVGKSTLQDANKSDDTTTPKPGIGLTDEQRIRIFGRPSSQSPDADRTAKDQQSSDQEIEAFIKSFSSTTSQPNTASSESQTSTKSIEPNPQLSSNYDRTLPDGSLDISPEVIYPRTMSCRQAFDQAFYCQSLGGKFNDIYRYGEVRSCSEQWGAFWFCMRSRSLGADTRADKIAEYYAQRDERRKGEFGSSEDIWEIRRTAVPKAFGKDPNLTVLKDGNGIKVQE